MSRAWLVDNTGKSEPILIEDDDGVRRYFAKGDDIYGKVLETLEDGSVVRVWRTRDEARHIQVYSAHNAKTMETVDLLELPAAVKSGMAVSL